jgi:glutamate-ammonia-ligase adenylyltransferase
MAAPRSPFAPLILARPPRPASAQKILRDHGFREPAAAWAALQRLRGDEPQRRSLRPVFARLMHLCAASADPDRALLHFERLVAALPNPSLFFQYLGRAPDRLELLVKIFAHSTALADTLARNATYFHFLIAPATLVAPRPKASLAAELSRQLLPLRVPADQYDAIRRFRRRETLRIGARDLTGAATVEDTTRELSNLADVCLQAVYDIAAQRLAKEYNVSPPRFVIIGLGKLGGQELNYSSDVDVVFVYDEDRPLTPTLSMHEYCTKLAEEIVRVVGAKSSEGTIFRIDLRLRPEGASGPLVRSLESCENYYAEWGETWERMAFIKARPVAGDLALGEDFLQMLQPFVYAKHAGAQVMQQMAAIKQRIETEIVRDERLTRHVKLGVGGIREIEFIVQSFQVLRGGRQPALRNRSTLRTLPALVQAKLLRDAEAQTLADAYRFLRNVEHRLQMEMEFQTHTIPDEDHAQYWLARAMGFPDVASFQARQNQHTGAVRQIYQAVLASAEEQAVPVVLTEAALMQAGFTDLPAAKGLLEGLTQGSGFAHLAPRTQELFGRLTPFLLAAAGKVPDPDTALARFEKFVSTYGSRGLLYELLARNPQLVEMLIRLGDASKFLADTLVQQPDLFDEVCRPGALGEFRQRPDLEASLQAARQPEQPVADWARVWKRGELLRIGIADVMGLADTERVHLELTQVAEVSLCLAVAEARRQLKLSKRPFAIIGLGKLGGQELGYGADLDVIFVGAGVPAIQLATHVIDFMSRATSAGKLFEVDARLRPDSQDGPLAGTVEAYRDYYRQRAELWERQALTRARFVAGDAALGAKFLKMAQAFVYRGPLTMAEVAAIRQMRRRVETERGNPSRASAEFKTGPGGLMDVEFLVQTLQLHHGHQGRGLRTAHTLAALNRLTATGIVDEADAASLRSYYLFLRRIESVLRREENTSVSQLPAGERELERLARRLGFSGRTAFEDAYTRATRHVRALYERWMPAGA